MAQAPSKTQVRLQATKQMHDRRDENGGVESEDEVSSAGSDCAEAMEIETLQAPHSQEESSQQASMHRKQQHQQSSQQRLGTRPAVSSKTSSSCSRATNTQRLSRRLDDPPAAQAGASADIASTGHWVQQPSQQTLQQQQQQDMQQQQMTQQPSQQSSQQVLSGDQLAVLYSSCLKLASENKIDRHNSWQLGLIDHLVRIHAKPSQRLLPHLQDATAGEHAILMSDALQNLL